MEIGREGRTVLTAANFLVVAGRNENSLVAGLPVCRDMTIAFLYTPFIDIGQFHRLSIKLRQENLTTVSEINSKPPIQKLLAVGVGEMSQWLATPAALLKDPGSIPSTQTVSLTPVSGSPIGSSGLLQSQYKDVQVVPRHTCRQNTFTC